MRPALLALALIAAAAPSGAAEPERKRLAGLAIHSDDYALRRKEGVVEEWTGHVCYHQHERDVSADWAERRHEGDRWTLRGRVAGVWRMPDETAVLAWGHEARFEAEGGTGTLLPKPGTLLRFERGLQGVPPGGRRPNCEMPELMDPDRAEGRRMTWDAKGERISLFGDVRTWGPSGRTWSDRADFDAARKRLELSGGRPVLVSGYRDWDGAVQADRVTAADRPRSVTADGKVRGWVYFHDRPARLRGL